MTMHLVGKVFGYLTVIQAAGHEAGTNRRLWLCRCECGKEKLYATYRLTGKHKPAQTCHTCEDHILRKDAYISWMSAKSRCIATTNKDYANYGGRGITMDPRWFEFKEFYKDMGDPPIDPINNERMSLERKDTNGNYCKENCEWANRYVQQNNKRSN